MITLIDDDDDGDDDVIFNATTTVDGIDDSASLRAMELIGLYR